MPILYDLSYFKFKWFGIIFFFASLADIFGAFFIVFFNYLETEFIFWIFASISKPCMIRVFGKHKQMVIKSLFIVICQLSFRVTIADNIFFYKKKFCWSTDGKKFSRTSTYTWTYLLSILEQFKFLISYKKNFYFSILTNKTWLSNKYTYK